MSLSTLSSETSLPALCILELIRKKISTPTAEIKPILQSKHKIIRTIIEVSNIPCVVSMTTRVATSPSDSMVFVVTEEISPILFELKYPMGRYRRCSAIRTLAKAAALYPPTVWSIVENFLHSTPTTIAAAMMIRDPQMYFFIGSPLMRPSRIYMTAGIFIAAAIASTSPITMESLNLLPFSLPQKRKNFLSTSNILFTLLCGILCRNMGFPHLSVKRAGSQ